MSDTFDIYWDHEAKDRFWHYVDSVKTEIGGFGYATRISASEIVVNDVWLAPQWVSSSEVDFKDGNGVDYAIAKAAEDGKLGEDDFVWVSWHSHNSMDVFWSSTDETCITGYGSAGIPALLSVVGNHKRQYKQRVDLFGVTHFGLAVPHVTCADLAMMLNPADPVYERAIKWDAEIKEMVGTRPMKPLSPKVGGYYKTGAAPTKQPTTYKPGVQKPTTPNSGDPRPSTNEATACRPSSFNKEAEYFIPGFGWVPESETTGEAWADTLGDENDQIDMDEYSSDTIMRGHELAVMVHNGELLSMDELSPDDRQALIAFYDITKNARLPEQV